MTILSLPNVRFPVGGPEGRRHNRKDNEFLPAALEIMETPASPIRIAILWFICLLAAGALLWAWLGTFDIVATAQGKVQPAGRVKIIQSLEAGRAKSVPVSNGMSVKAGDVLVEIDDAEIGTEENAARSSLQAFQAEVARRGAVLAVIAAWQKQEDRRLRADILQNSGRSPNFAEDIPGAIRSREENILRADLAQLASALNNLDAQRRQRQAEIDSLDQAITAQASLVKTLEERVNMRSALVKSSAGTRAQVIDALQEQQEAAATLAAQKGQQDIARAALQVAISEADKLVNAVIAENAAKLSEAGRRVDELQQQLIKAKKRRELMTIRSPIDGSVQLSGITTVGQVVTAGTELMRVVPEGTLLEIEAYVPNRDIGFVAAGQPAVIKVEAYPFTRFGIIEGRVERVATDAIPEPDAQQLESAAAKEPQSIVPTGNAQRMQNLVFPISVRPDQATIDVNGKVMPLTPGMAVTVEVKTGKRRILEYLFSPLVEITSEAMREF
ncbi:HlyD family type I secretion periplasmic adaptor subunit [Brucella endophytica]|uniref:Membrane fusion protein (MFP) family protein n=1 Tax=Brucella endophytica TaxID=1963359 RepID=A0A916WL81_9HYPH|nr:HlyD family type I secretion periplasmic adaptor subunit [Brucella endophytica]GGB10584.1 HlyD family type I secretion periplasmic adaptor subunit [Brucella endophytica]